VPPDLVRCIDLLGVSVSAGLGIRDAVRSVAALGTGPTGTEFARVVADVHRGAALGDALSRAADRTGSLRPLVTTLAVTMASGAPAAPALQRLADAERRRSRRRVEARVRRLPVLLAVPLVVCILPAFVVLTLVPVGIAAVDRLPRDATPFPATASGPSFPPPSSDPPRSPP
jgi:pilus assembly protein TadC